MTISINNPIQATWIFGIIFFIALLASIRRKPAGDFFSPSLTQELKGFAILAVVFSHIGYFLASDTRFLFPLSVMAGVGVNLFLLLSGLGLTASSLKNKLSVWQFYKKRLIKLFPPLWLTLIIFLSLDFFVLHLTYSWQVIAQAFVGIFRNANLYTDLNAPLWYFTLILFYYLIFPLVFSKKQPWLSALAIYLISFFLLKQAPTWLVNVSYMYEVHLLAFPLGVLLGWLFYGQCSIWRLVPKKLCGLQCQISCFNNKLKEAVNKIKPVIYYSAIIFLLIFIAYFTNHSGVGKSLAIEQQISIMTTLAVICLFMIKKIEFRLFYWFGLYSYEIYLIHWPLAYRYDLIFKYLPAWLAMIVYLVVALILGAGLRKLSKLIIK